MLYILTDLKRNNNQWTYGIIRAVEKEFTRRRIDFAKVSDIKGTIKRCASTGDIILIPTPITSFALSVVDECNQAGVQVIVPNGFLNIGERYRFHCVRGDFFSAVTNILHGFKRAGKSGIALYGVNSNAQDDILLADAYLAQTGHSTDAVFYNDGSIHECFDAFFKNRHNFDAVICANDYVTLALIEKLKTLDPGYLEELFIVSFSNTLLSQFYNVPFTSLAPDLDAVSCAVGDIYRIVKHYGYNRYCAVTIYVDYKIHERGLAQGYFQNGKPVYDSKAVFFPIVREFNEATAFDVDPEIAWLPKIEIFLNKLTERQLTILMLLLQGYSNSIISEKLCLSDETVRYHMKKIRSLLGCSTKEELYRQVRDILEPKNIEKYLINKSE
jgi:DNA-binding CsgD family transcriptional regulator